jgi:hypothetical protein
VVPALLALGLGLAPAAVGAQTVPDQAAAVRPSSLAEARLLLALPAALSTGMAAGVDAAYGRTWGRWLAWGARASWATATEHTLSWAVRNDDIRLRMVGALRKEIGRATLALRLGLGATLVREDRTRSQGSSAGLAGQALESTTWSALPALELEPAVVLRLFGGWGMSLSGGPSLHVLDGGARWGWLSALGVSWQR